MADTRSGPGERPSPRRSTSTTSSSSRPATTSPRRSGCPPSGSTRRAASGSSRPSSGASSPRGSTSPASATGSSTPGPRPWPRGRPSARPSGGVAAWSSPTGSTSGRGSTGRRPITSGSRNRFLARLPEAEYRRLLPLLEPVELELEQVLYEARGPIDYAYFPDRGRPLGPDRHAGRQRHRGGDRRQRGAGRPLRLRRQDLAPPGHRPGRRRGPPHRVAGLAGGGRRRTAR